MANTVDSIFIVVDRNRFFVIAVVMEGQRSGSNGNSWWFDFDDRIANFEARLQDVDMGKTAHQHREWTHVHCGRNKGGGRRRRRSGGRGNAMISHKNKMAREQHNKRQLNNQPAQWEANMAAQ
jgi:hypothetical protein